MSMMLRPGGDGGVAASAGSASASTGTIVFSNSNNVTFGMNGSTVTASASAAPTTVNLNDVGNATADKLFTFGTNAQIQWQWAGGGSFSTNATRQGLFEIDVVGNLTDGADVLHIHQSVGNPTIDLLHLEAAGTGVDLIHLSAARSIVGEINRPIKYTGTEASDTVPMILATQYSNSVANLNAQYVQGKVPADFVAATATVAGTNVSGTIASNGISLSAAAAGGGGVTDGLFNSGFGFPAAIGTYGMEMNSTSCDVFRTFFPTPAYFNQYYRAASWNFGTYSFGSSTDSWLGQYNKSTLVNVYAWRRNSASSDVFDTYASATGSIGYSRILSATSNSWTYTYGGTIYDKTTPYTWSTTQSGNGNYTYFSDNPGSNQNNNSVLPVAMALSSPLNLSDTGEYYIGVLFWSTAEITGAMHDGQKFDAAKEYTIPYFPLTQVEWRTGAGNMSSSLFPGGYLTQATSTIASFNGSQLTMNSRYIVQALKSIP